MVHLTILPFRYFAFGYFTFAMLIFFLDTPEHIFYFLDSIFNGRNKSSVEMELLANVRYLCAHIYIRH